MFTTCEHSRYFFTIAVDAGEFSNLTGDETQFGRLAESYRVSLESFLSLLIEFDARKCFLKAFAVSLTALY